MNILSFIAAIALAVTLIEGFYILLRDIKSGTNRLFFLICLAISVWLFGGCFGYSAQSREDTFFWLKVASPGFIFMHAFVLHFVCRYAGKFKGRMLYVIYLPSFYFLYVSITDHLVFSDIYKSGNYWVMVPDYHSPNLYLLMLNYLGYYIIALVLLYNYTKTTGSYRIRRQGRIIFAAIIVTITSYNVEPFLAPLFFNYLTYGQAPVYSIAWISLIWYAMMKYGFLGLQKQLLIGDILNSLTEMVIITDVRKNIILINRVLSRKLGTGNTIKSLDGLFIEHEMIDRLLDLAHKKPVSSVMLNLALPGEKTMLVKGDITLFRDNFNDTAGYVIIARGVEGSYPLLKKKGVTRREYELIKMMLSGNSNRRISEQLDISLRTVETHITNTYKKLGMKSRMELLNYCAEMFNSPHK